MKVRYRPTMGIVMIISGIIIVALNLYLMNVRSRLPIQLFMGFFFLIIGFLHLNRTLFELRENEIVLFNAFGMVVKRYAFNSIEDLSVIGNAVYLEKNGKPKKLRLSSQVANKEEWNQFISIIRRKPSSSSSHPDLLDTM